MKDILRFRSNQRFKIVQFTDIHWHNGEAPDQQSAKLMTQIAKAESPDLIVLTGDILSGGGCADAADSLRQVIKTVEACEVPWAAVFGNHDDEGDADRHELMAVMQESKLSLSQPGPEDVPGVGNYVLPIQSSEAKRICCPTLFYRLWQLLHRPTSVATIGLDASKSHGTYENLLKSPLKPDIHFPPLLFFSTFRFRNMMRCGNFHTCYWCEV